MLLRLVNEPKIILYLLCSQIGLSLLMPLPAPQKSDTGKFLQKRIYEIQVVASRAHTHTHTHTQSAHLFNALESNRDKKMSESPGSILERRKIAVHEEILQCSYIYY